MQKNLNEPGWSKGVLVQLNIAKTQGIELLPYAQRGYSEEILKQIRRAKIEHVDLDEYLDEGYDGEQLQEIRIAKRMGIDLDDYLERGFCGPQLRQLRKGFSHFIDVGLYNKECYNWLQMREIRLGLQNRVDATKYANPLYSYAQMREIRLGLEEGIDVSSYAKLLYSCMDMEEKRKQLVEQLYASNTELEDIIITDEASGLTICLASNRMQAYVTFPKEQRRVYLTVDYIEQMLKRHGIIYGIDRENINKALQEEIYDTAILVAQGKEAKRGEDGRYEYYFELNPSRKPVETYDGKIDYKNVQIFEEVMEGQTIARYIPPTQGEGGICVRGMGVPGVKGKELPAIDGEGITLKEDKLTYVAAKTGIIEYKNNMIRIFEALIIKEDVTASYGNVNFHGCIHIYGNIGSNVDVQAEGSITVEGTVESAYIQSNSDVLIKNGMAGSGKGKIRAGGNIIGKFFEAAELTAMGNIEAGCLMNSNSVANNKVIIQGKKGAIIGGKTRGVYGVEAYNIGNRSQIYTEIETGCGQEIMEMIQNCQNRYEELQEQVMQNASLQNRFNAAQKKTLLYRKLLNDQRVLNERIEELIKERQQLQNKLQADCNVSVMSRAHAGTKIIINDVVKLLDEELRNVTFTILNKEIICR